jgi:hypothetical protein
MTSAVLLFVKPLPRVPTTRHTPSGLRPQRTCRSGAQAGARAGFTPPAVKAGRLGTVPQPTAPSWDTTPLQPAPAPHLPHHRAGVPHAVDQQPRRERAVAAALLDAHGHAVRVHLDACSGASPSSRLRHGGPARPRKTRLLAGPARAQPVAPSQPGGRPCVPHPTRPSAPAARRPPPPACPASAPPGSAGSRPG